jgi:hypothetical protein
LIYWAREKHYELVENKPIATTKSRKRTQTTRKKVTSLNNIEIYFHILRLYIIPKLIFVKSSFFLDLNVYKY